MEKLTSLAALRAGDMEKIQKLESELDRAAAHKHNYEEKGKKYKAAMEEVCAGHDYGNPCKSFCARGHGTAFSHKADFCRRDWILLLASINKGGLPCRGGEIRGLESGGRGGGLCSKTYSIRFLFLFNYHEVMKALLKRRNPG